MRRIRRAGDSADLMIESSAVAKVAGLRDPNGVLSVYVDSQSHEPGAQMPSWPETVHTRLRELCSPGRLDELHTKIAPLLDPTAFGRGRAMFFGAAGGPAITFGTQLDMGTSVSIGASAELRPLLAAMDAGRPAGIVVATIDITRIIEVADGEVKELETTRHAPPGFVWSELKEPNHAYQEDMRRIVRSVAESVERWVTARSWDRLVVAGNARLTRPVVQELAARADLTAIDAHRDVAAEEHPAQIQQRFADELDRAAASRAAALVDRARVMGAGDVLAAASDGRAAWVALDSEGTLEIAEGEWEALGSGSVAQEVDVAALIIERALETDATVAVLPGADHPKLREAGAVALLRW